ncbi:hypothetical protein HPDFL43_00014200 [Hoeflea phototrophica DFL-43]|uniref:Uncharacterized protein n=1 Tax=Hoeflea phototrophica (strain DSM 17068 / NCIMB 14078 / DFL-43) TaxID=411684 RepID=A0A094YYM7_HOEPD|nr:hypothetical protein HPDFL43_00014200 [Hoeflea phototrophica DFL-43]
MQICAGSAHPGMLRMPKGDKNVAKGVRIRRWHPDLGAIQGARRRCEAHCMDIAEHDFSAIPRQSGFKRDFDLLIGERRIRLRGVRMVPAFPFREQLIESIKRVLVQSRRIRTLAFICASGVLVALAGLLRGGFPRRCGRPFPQNWLHRLRLASVFRCLRRRFWGCGFWSGICGMRRMD